MKIAFTATGDSLNAPLDPRFGRAAGFLIYDDEAGAIESINNEQNLQATQGAGIQAATTLAKAGVDLLITGHCGPKAFQVLQAAGIKVYLSQAKTIADAYELFKAGKLEAADGPNADSHWM